VPTVPFGGVAFWNDGTVDEEVLTVIDTFPELAGEPTPLLACTANVYEPLVVGIPLKTPLEANVKPGGSVPETTLYVGVGTPEAINAYEYEEPVLPLLGDATEKLGATSTSSLPLPSSTPIGSTGV
jgi:hypothetical protein